MAFWRNYYHLVWATWNREPFITEVIEERLYGYLVARAAELDTFVHAINGVPDHLHLIANIPPKHSVAWVVKCLKGASSHFVNETLRPAAFHFAWQRGYGCLTLGETQRATAIQYVERQKQHHQAQTVNHWLEHITELDEGPGVNPQLSAAPSSPKTLRETTVPYEPWSPAPF